MYKRIAATLVVAALGGAPHGRRRRTRPRTHAGDRARRQARGRGAHQRRAHEGLHRPHRRGQPARAVDQRRALAQPGGAARGARVGPRPPHGLRARAARGPAGPAQGQHRRRRDADHGVLDRARALRARPRRDDRHQAARPGRGDPRQGQPDRVRGLRLQQPAERQRLAQRAGPEPVRPLDRSRRLVERLRRRGRRGPGGADDRLGQRGLDHLARDPEQRRRHPAVHRAVEPRRGRPDLRVAGHARPARADRRRRGAAAQRGLAEGSARPAHGRRRPRASTTPRA